MHIYNTEEQMKRYTAPMMEIYVLAGNDVVTASNPNDNNYGDIDWE